MFDKLLQRIQESTKLDKLKDGLIKPSLDLLIAKGYKNVDEERPRHYFDMIVPESDKTFIDELYSLKDAFEEGDKEKAIQFFKDIPTQKKEKKVKTEAREKIDNAFAEYKETSDPIELLELLKQYPKEAEKLRKETIKFLKKREVLQNYIDLVVREEEKKFFPIHRI